jgi:hypothetical protein
MVSANSAPELPTTATGAIFVSCCLCEALKNDSRAREAKIENEEVKIVHPSKEMIVDRTQPEPVTSNRMIH